MQVRIKHALTYWNTTGLSRHWRRQLAGSFQPPHKEPRVLVKFVIECDFKGTCTLLYHDGDSRDWPMGLAMDLQEAVDASCLAPASNWAYAVYNGDLEGVELGAIYEPIDQDVEILM